MNLNKIKLKLIDKRKRLCQHVGLFLTYHGTMSYSY